MYLKSFNIILLLFLSSFSEQKRMGRGLINADSNESQNKTEIFGNTLEEISDIVLQMGGNSNSSSNATSQSEQKTMEDLLNMAQFILNSLISHIDSEKPIQEKTPLNLP